MGALINNCKPKFRSVSMGKLVADSVAYFYKLRDPERCKIYGFKNASADNAGLLYSHNFKDKPDAKICGLDKCDLTGTLFVTPETGEKANASKVVSPVKANGEDYQYGYLRLFVFGKGIYKVTIKNSNDDKNMNVYNITVADDSWHPVVLELFNPDEVVGTGWVGKNSAFDIVIEPKQATPYRLSTVELFDDIYDLVQDMTIGFECITDFSGDPALTITEELCGGQSYDSKATKIERSLTASNIIGELAEFHNITKRKKNLEHVIQDRGKFTAKEEKVNETIYACFTIPELAEIHCPRLLVQPEGCNIMPLYHVDVDNDDRLIQLGEEHFFRKGNKLYLNEVYKDTTITVAYPIVVEGTAWDITTTEIENTRYQMEIVTPIGKDEYVIKADNVFITALPLTWTGEAGTFTVPFTMAKDSEGKFGEIIKIDNRK